MPPKKFSVFKASAALLGFALMRKCVENLDKNHDDFGVEKRLCL